MTAQEFNVLLENRIQSIRDVLQAKAHEYASEDRLHNFKADAGGLRLAESPAERCWGYMLKHLQSVYDMVSGIRPVTPAAVKEKVGDLVNYLVLLEAIFTEDMGKRQ